LGEKRNTRGENAPSHRDTTNLRGRRAGEGMILGVRGSPYGTGNQGTHPNDMGGLRRGKGHKRVKEKKTGKLSNNRLEKGLGEKRPKKNDRKTMPGRKKSKYTEVR